ncbi:MAG: phosphoribosyl-AMP cyclohydrolase, partial [Bacteroidetes bacterium]|nr:phosphoribosyl-AMP cyclohydrolase [Bacteroidota bacterium]
AACHTGNRSCFYRKLENVRLVDVGVKIFDPEKVYKKK